MFVFVDSTQEVIRVFTTDLTNSDPMQADPIMPGTTLTPAQDLGATTVSGAGGDDTLEAGETLQDGQSLVSQNGRFRLKMQADGNLVLYVGDGTGMWATSTAGTGADHLVMQSDLAASLSARPPVPPSGAARHREAARRMPSCRMTATSSSTVALQARAASRPGLRERMSTSMTCAPWMPASCPRATISTSPSAG